MLTLLTLPECPYIQDLLYLNFTHCNFKSAVPTSSFSFPGYSSNRPDDDHDLRQSDTVDREWRRQYKGHRATVAMAEQHRANRNSMY